MSARFLRRVPVLDIVVLVVSSLVATLLAVGAWVWFLSILAPPVALECKRIHDGEVLVSSTQYVDGSVFCEYIAASSLGPMATTTRRAR